MKYGFLRVAMRARYLWLLWGTQRFDGSFLSCIYEANNSAAALVNLLVENFSCFRDETTFEGRQVRLYKRAQILVADLWACFDGKGYGEFYDIEKITMFAGK
jgi:Potential Queuosine, Q, salvage protein family